MSLAVAKEFLTLDEFARMVERSYGAVRLWAMDGRLKAKMTKRRDRTYYRVPVKEAERVKAEIDRGAWV